MEHNGSWDDIPVVTHKNKIASDPRWVSLAKLANCNWFNRAWVTHEAGLSARPQILYGNHDIDWESCIAVLSWLLH
ncbi:hypothetical protein K432DRAFT_307113 [Lepidopterella palustris CBS 459.81]|uniref:Heterokaryon incompatibility domain-containing protein n=1 Tax=Lepidopterella palustris CBS 459.81 TaxID=1314670 RepID=A0A8E2E2D4_9PEZI|nr:hypothetical protein K432DRAFT_307113 [Lepidopterella palustris CBS 459.81]